ncbi:MAG: hypothetical protein AAB795_02105 [Patescibacteria group bacterium]
MKNTFWFIIVILLVASIGGAYWYRVKIEQPFQLPEVPIGAASELIERLGKIKIDLSLFEDKRFMDLDPFPIPSLEGVQKGKINPFSLSTIQ